jgi:gliding motility-associated-like protein
MRTILLTIFLTIISSDLKLAGQKIFCADSSIRLKYNTNFISAELKSNADTSGKNIFSGGFIQATSPTRGIVAFKTNWGDSILWAKKYYLNNLATTVINSFEAPSGTMLFTGYWGNSNNDFLLSRMDTTGIILWTKRYRLSQSHFGTYNSQFTNKNVLIKGNSIYFYSFLAGNLSYDIIAKADLNGNLLWTKSFEKSFLSNTGRRITDAPVLYNDTVYVLSNVTKDDNVTGQTLERYSVITKLNDFDGSVIESIAFKVVPDNIAKGVVSQYIRLNSDKTFSLAGSLSITLPNGEPSSGSNFTFNLTLDKNLNPVNSSYYKTNSSLVLDGSFTFDFNNRKQNVFLYGIDFSNNKFFVTFDENKNILRTRKFLLSPTGTFRSSVNFDDKQNIHFTYNYQQNNKAVAEYARISDLAPANTVSCFGIDTTILQSVPFTLTKESFTWDVEYTNIVSSFPVNLLEAPETITKQVICKQVSYCDSIKIKGNPAVCLPGSDIRFSTYLNPQCLKSVKWAIDTSFASIVNAEADSAVTLRFKKNGQFYLKALVYNCVVADSVLVTITSPQTGLQLNKKDSLLCPGSSVILNVNPAFRAYQWQDGSTQNSYTATAPGLYTITATDSCGNIVKDSINIRLADTSFIIQSFYTICPLDSAAVLLPADVYNISWQPSVFGTLNNNRLLLYPPQASTYTVNAKRLPGCDLQKTITVAEKDCPEWVRIPSAFTPNNDGLNDSFRPIISGRVSSFSIKIFERNGQLIYNSSNPYSGWNGTIKGVQQNSGIFVYTCTYRFVTGTEQFVKGTFMLIR